MSFLGMLSSSFSPPSSHPSHRSSRHSSNSVLQSTGNPLTDLTGGIGTAIGGIGIGVGQGVGGLGTGVGQGVGGFGAGFGQRAGSLVDTLTNPLVIIGVGAIVMIVVVKM